MSTIKAWKTQLKDANTDEALNVTRTEQLGNKNTLDVTPHGDLATETNQDAQITEAQSTNTKLDTLNAELVGHSTEAKQDSIITELQGIDAAQATAANQSTQITEAQSTNTKLDTLNAELVGHSTEAKQDDIITELQSLTIPPPVGGATEAKQDTQITELQAINTELDSLSTELVGHSTEAKQDTVIANLGVINTTVSNRATEVTAAGIRTDVQAVNTTLASQATETTLSSAVTEQQSTNTKLDSVIAELQLIKQADPLVTVNWDYRDLSYVTAGNGIGEVETIEMFTGTPGSGTLVQTLTFTYDASSNVTRIVRS